MEKVAYHGLPKYKTHRDNNYAPETMVTDGNYVYAYFGMTGIYCYDLNGNLIWEKDLGNYPMQSNWGTSTSPALYNGLLFMQIDNEEKSFLTALDAKTGNVKWQVDRDEKSNWGTPMIWKNSIRNELVTSGLKTRSYNPETGELLWEIDMGGGRNITSPTAEGDMIFVGNEKRRDGGTLFGIKAGASGDISLKEGELSNDFVVWSVPESGIAMASPLVYKGLLYLVDRNRGQISCFKAATGNVVYPGTKWQMPKLSGLHHGLSTVKFIALMKRNNTHYSGRTRIQGIGKNKLDDIFWASTAISKSSYIFRGEKGIYCVR
ncbi:MAG: PQQ-like beta-propeller repeat protein [Draconibacterium sp.]|nr:PQQ-like beta-propeller repeat protein [Draconibacterium sp.]